MAVTDLAILEKRFRQIPLFNTLPFEFLAAGEGTAELKLKYSREYDGVFNSLHGGFMITLADSVACMAVMTLAGLDAVVTTTDMNIRFLSPCRTDATAKARVIKFGGSLVPVEVNLFDESGKHVAVSQVTYMRLKR